MLSREERLDAVVAALLMVGATAGLLLMALGMGFLLAGPQSTGSDVLDPRDVFRGAATLDPVDLMKAGILILMATPAMGVAALVPGFLWVGRRRFALVSLLVLGLLAVSFVLATRR